MNIEDAVMDIHDKIDQIDVEPSPGDGIFAAAIVGGAIAGGAAIAIAALPIKIAVRACSRTAHDAYEAFDTVRESIKQRKAAKKEKAVQQPAQQSPDRIAELEAEIEKLRAQLPASTDTEVPVVEAEVVEQPT